MLHDLYGNPIILTNHIVSMHEIADRLRYDEQRRRELIKAAEKKKHKKYRHLHGIK